MTSATVAASTSAVRGRSGSSATRERGRWTVAIEALQAPTAAVSTDEMPGRWDASNRHDSPSSELPYT